MKLISAFAGGLAGACAMTLLHEVIKRFDKDAPRMDLTGMEAISKVTKAAGGHVPGDDTLYKEAIAGDIAGNAAYYSLAGLGGGNTDLKGLLLGVASGIGAIYMPGLLGLSEENSGRTDKTKALTTLYYSVGGLVASQVMQLIDKKLSERR